VIVHGITDNDIFPPLFGATQRLMGLYRGLARRHQVRVLCVVPYRNRGRREERVHDVTLLRRRAWYTPLAWRLERLRVAPLFLAAHGHRARARRLLGELGEGADVLIADLGVAATLERERRALRVYHAHNVEADHFRHAGPRLPARSWWADRLQALEARAASSADLVVAVSDEDAARLGSLYGVAAERLEVIPNGYDETALAPPAPGERERARAALGVTDQRQVAVFMGSDVPHNRAGLSLVLERVAPRLGGGFTLLVAGGVSRMVEGWRRSWLVTRPATADVAPLLHAADVGLNPVVTGGGSNVKLPTYLAAGIAVLSTPHGTRGYGDLTPWVTVAGPEAFADALASPPVGWHAAGHPPPPPLAGYAWGRLGERLGERLEAHRAGSVAVATAATRTAGPRAPAAAGSGTDPARAGGVGA
jgi:glycosyltransferase involved in cell wall biosynthesis